MTSLATVPAQARTRATITQKQPGVIYGLELAQATFRELDPGLCGRARRRGGPVARGWAGARRRGAYARRARRRANRAELPRAPLGDRDICSAGRAGRYGDAAQVLDTRKTTPGMRSLEKAAVAAGGAHNHRAGLYDRILIKDNHIAAAGSSRRRCRPHAPHIRSLRRRRGRGDDAGGDRRGARGRRADLLLDNMSDEQLAAAVERLRAARASRPAEASASRRCRRSLPRG